MNISLLSCSAKRPDRRAISQLLEEVAEGVDSSLATELTNILLDGSPVEIEVLDKTTNSAYRALRKLNIDYEIIED